MTRSELRRIKALKTRIKKIRGELWDISGGDVYVGDTYKDYESGQGIVKVVRGYGMSEAAYNREQSLRVELARKNRELQERLAEMENWLETVGDETLKKILRLKYRNGLTYDEIAASLGISEKTVRRKINIFFPKPS